MLNNMKFSIEEKSDKEDVNYIKNGLCEYNKQFADPDNHKKLNVFVKDDNNKIIGGLLGGTYWDWLYVDIFWLNDSCRKKGLGTKILYLAEHEAKARGCQFAYLETHDFQALDFYKKNNYEVAGELKDLPKGHSKYIMKKELK